MSDPLSVAASIAGLISITVEAVKFLSPYVSAAKETPQVAAHVYSEVQSTQIILMGLQSLTKDLKSVNAQHAALIGVNQVVAVLTDGVLLYSELHKELQSLWAKDGVEKVPLRGRLQWVWKESTFVSLLNRLQNFKSSMTLVLMILQSDSGQRAKEHQEKLSNNVKVLLDSNDALSRRLMNIEDALDDQTIISRRMSILSLSVSPSQNTGQESTAESPIISITNETSPFISRFDFEDDLESSRVYRRAVRETMDYSFRSSVAKSHNWSVFSGLSLGDVSIMSVIALPVYQDDITNAEHYDFGEEAAPNAGTPVPVMDQPLLIECLELKLKLLTIPGMSGYFDEPRFTVDDFSHLWTVLQQVTPLVILAQALDPTLNLGAGLPEDLTDNARKELILWFAQFCHDKLDIETSSLITVQDLMGGGAYGIFKAISLISYITRNLAIPNPSMNDLSSAKAQVDAQPPELRKLLIEQRQFARDLNELLELKDQLQMFSNHIFLGLRILADTHVAFLTTMERKLFCPSALQIWAPAFDDILKFVSVEASFYVNYTNHRASIQLWLKKGHFKNKEKIRESLVRCLYLLPTRAKRISMLFKFSEYLGTRPIATEEQRKDRSRCQSSISSIVSHLQDKEISTATQVAVQELRQRVEDWKGIDPGDLGEMILSKTLYVTKSSKTNLYHGYLFQNMLLLCKETRGKHIGERSSSKSKSLSEEKQTKFILKGRFHLRHILSVTPTSHHGKHTCEVEWSTGTEGIKSSFSLMFVVEPEMREWASKIDEYRMMAILMVKPQGVPELNLQIEGAVGETVPEDLTGRMKSRKRYGVIK